MSTPNVPSSDDSAAKAINAVHAKSIGHGMTDIIPPQKTGVRAEMASDRYSLSPQKEISSTTSLEVVKATETRTELSPERKEKLKPDFDKRVAMWERLGALREGYQKPTFDDVEPFLAKNPDMLDDGSPEELNKSYNRMSLIPRIPVRSERTEELTLLGILEKVLLKELDREGPDKKKGQLVIKPRGKTVVLEARQIYVKYIVYSWKEYAKQEGMVFEPSQLDPDSPGGTPEENLASSATSFETRTGFSFRAERSTPIRPSHIGKTAASALDFMPALTDPAKNMPKGATYQDARAYLAEVIRSVEEDHCLPDAWMPETEDSQVSLLPSTYFKNESNAGAVGVAGWITYEGRFYLGRRGAADPISDNVVRAGVRMSE